MRKKSTGLRDTADAVDRGEAVLVTSTLIHAEVLDAVSDETVRKRLSQFLQRSNVVQQPVTDRIAREAGNIRHKTRLRANTKCPKTPDAIFIASAVAHGCEALHTYDTGLLSLSKRPEVKSLNITIPSIRQPRLPFLMP